MADDANKLTVYTEEEAKQASTTYYKGDTLAADAFVEKYALRDGPKVYELTPDAMHRRLAREFARIEANYPNPLSAPLIYDYFATWTIIPQGSPMSGIGNPFQVQSVSNCFVAAAPEDSYGGIFRADEEIVQIAKRRGGVGLDLSTLRPAGAATRNAARTTEGVVAFAQRFSNSTREVGQNGRRGALMLTIDVRHPDVEAFIKMKADLTKVTGANISVRVTDSFMHAVLTEQDYVQRWPVDAKDEDVKISRVVPAKRVWDAIIKQAHATGEPGVLFWDTVLEESPADCYADEGFRTTSTNPCQPAWATVLTPKGISTIGQLQVGDTIWSGHGWTAVTAKWSTGVKPVYRYETRTGVFYGTKNHRVIADGVKTEAQFAEVIDANVCLSSHRDGLEMPLRAEDVLAGLLIGDGTVKKEGSTSGPYVLLCVGDKDQDYFTSEVAHLINPVPFDVRMHRVEGVEGGIVAKELPRTFLRQVPDRYFCADGTTVRGFLRGLYSANGSVVNGRVTLKATSSNVIERVQMMLSSIGIRSYVTENQPADVEFANGVYTCKRSYDLNITRDRVRFSSLIGFIQGYKQEKLDEACKMAPSHKPAKDSFEVVSSHQVSTEEVFDITVADAEHTYWTGGLLVSNCSELPLPDYDSCRLLLLNLTKFVRGAYGFAPVFNHVAFTEAVRHAQRLMDDLIDLELESIERILAKIESDPEADHVKARERALWEKVRAKARAGRRTGLGITGLGDALAMLGMRYGSEDATKMVEEIYSTLAVACYESSMTLANERGAFPIWDAAKENDNPYLKLIKKTLRSDSLRRRNIACLTTAPAGTTSAVAFGVTGGIEPLFKIKYKRRRKVNGENGARVDFVDASGDQWQEYEVFHPGHLEWARINNKDPEKDIEQSPYFNSTADKVKPEEKVAMISAAQQWVDHGISNTANMPSEATVEDVAKLYVQAWKDYCKGITVYREGSRTGVLVASDREQKAVEASGEAAAVAATPARRRLPETLAAIRHKFRIASHEGYIHVGHYEDGTPGEVFIKMAKEGSTVSGLMDTIATLFSIALQYHVPLKTLVDKFSHTSFEPSGFTGNQDIPRASSIVDYVVRWLDKRYETKVANADAVVDTPQPSKPIPVLLASQPVNDGPPCHVCGQLMYRSAKCYRCSECGADNGCGA